MSQKTKIEYWKFGHYLITCLPRPRSGPGPAGRLVFGVWLLKTRGGVFLPLLLLVV
jgi:hypothetical protein